VKSGSAIALSFPVVPPQGTIGPSDEAEEADTGAAIPTGEAAALREGYAGV